MTGKWKRWIWNLIAVNWRLICSYKLVSHKIDHIETLLYDFLKLQPVDRPDNSNFVCHARGLFTSCWNQEVVVNEKVVNILLAWVLCTLKLMELFALRGVIDILTSHRISVLCWQTTYLGKTCPVPVTKLVGAIADWWHVHWVLIFSWPTKSMLSTCPCMAGDQVCMLIVHSKHSWWNCSKIHALGLNVDFVINMILCVLK